VVDPLDGVDRGPAAPGVGVVEDVVVDERAHLHELDRGRRVDHAVVERVAGGGAHDREQRAEALAAGRRHPHRRGPEQRAAGAERVGDAVVDGAEALREIGDAEHLAQPCGRQLGRGFPGGAGQGGNSIGRGGVHRSLLVAHDPGGRP
jgi:hypothetical protein